MNELPDLKQLSHEQKDELIIQLWSLVGSLMQEVKELKATVAAQQKRIEELEGRLVQNSSNSSKPPSSDGLNKPQPKSLRQSGERSSGGQKGHAGKTLTRVDKPDHIIIYDVPSTCDACGQALPCAKLAEVRQEFDLPRLAYEVTEHRQMRVRCACGQMHTGQFPSHVRASVQYGPRALSAMVHLNQYHLLPLQRTTEVMEELFGLAVSPATVYQASVLAKERLALTVKAIGCALQTAPVAHADETGLRVAKSLHWLHTLSNVTFTWMARHAKRGGQAFAELDLLPHFKGTLVHDGWEPYRALACTHSLCNAHHLRELTYVYEVQKQDWAADMIALLAHANEQANGKPVSPERLAHWRYVYDTILEQGEATNPRQAATGKRGRTRQSKATNLIGRLRTYAEDVWRFASEVGVPFTNNLAEQAIRMPKVKQKIAGCFRTVEGADLFCVIRSYLATMRKQGARLFDSLVQTFRGAVPQPAFVIRGAE